MRILDYISFGLKNLIYYKKRTICNIIITFSIILIILITFTASNTIISFLEENINKNIEYRTMYVKYDVMEESLSSVMKKLSKVKNVIKVIEQDKYQSYITIDKFKTNKTDGEINIIASDSNLLPSIVAGRNPNSNDKNYLICPTKFIADSNLSTRTDLTKEDYIDGRKFLNKEITIKYYSYDYSKEIPEVLNQYEEEFQLIGLYNTYDNYAKDNTCYTSFTNVAKINKNMSGNSEEYTEEVYYHPIIIVNDSKNIDSVFEEINSMGYTPIKRMNIDSNLIGNIKLICLSILLIAIVISIICMITIILKNIKEQEQEIGLLKALGYTNKNISLSFLVESLIIGLISFFISILIYTILYFIISNLINNTNLIFTKIAINYSWYSVLISFIIIIIIPIISTFTWFKKIKNINIVNLINNE